MKNLCNFTYEENMNNLLSLRVTFCDIVVLKAGKNNHYKTKLVDFSKTLRTENPQLFSRAA